MGDQVGSARLAGLGLVVAVAVAALVYMSFQPGGHIETAGGSVCEWRTEGDVTQERALVLNCKCPSGTKYSCRYVGKPDLTCPPFWRDFFDFFKQLRGVFESEDTCIYIHVANFLCGKHISFHALMRLMG